MRLRPRCARWFEIVVPRPLLARAVERLAATGAAELDTESESGACVDLSHVERALSDFQQLERRFQDYWPEARVGVATSDRHLESALEQSLQQLRAWQQEATPRIERLEHLARERGRHASSCWARSGPRRAPRVPCCDCASTPRIAPT